MPDVYFPRDPDNPVSVAHYALAAGDVATAERASRDALSANPHSISARINLAADRPLRDAVIPAEAGIHSPAERGSPLPRE